MEKNGDFNNIQTTKEAQSIEPENCEGNLDDHSLEVEEETLNLSSQAHKNTVDNTNGDTNQQNCEMCFRELQTACGHSVCNTMAESESYEKKSASNVVRNSNPRKPIVPTEVRNSNPKKPVAPTEVRNSNPKEPVAPNVVRNSDPKKPVAPTEVRNSDPKKPVAPTEVRNSDPQKPVDSEINLQPQSEGTNCSEE
ncbi:hypothetical protein FQA39_LY11083 [Lamprigera yunnana]|nr:hypothetical protein FQA39_LY11083 [Lamprigera yunnana]